MPLEINDNPNSTSCGSGQDTAPLLRLHQATVVKNGRRLLDGVTLEIREGEHTAILGPNGAGKSSFLRLVSYQDYPLALGNGEPPLTVWGQSLWNVFELRRLLGIVSADLQASFLNRTLPGRTRGLAAVLSGFFASFGLFRHQEITPAMTERAHLALALLEAAPLADKFIEEMSTGEIRRILLARALVPDPRALLLDEPTAGLDLLARQRFHGTLQNLARHGKTIILVTHRLEEIFPEIQRVILLQCGRVLLAGPKGEVLTSRNLSTMFKAPIQVQETNGYYSAVSS